MELRAFEHAQHGGWDGPPYAAAMALPRPRQWLKTNAVSRDGAGGPDDAA